MIDFIILLQSHPYAVVGQKHGGWVGFLQSHLLNSLKCLWFDRAESKDKRMAAGETGMCVCWARCSGVSFSCKVQGCLMDTPSRQQPLT